MIDPTEKDIGRAVVYTAQHKGALPEEGVITGVGHMFVYVRYGNYQTPRATKRGDLEWKHGGPENSPEAA